MEGKKEGEGNEGKKGRKLGFKYTEHIYFKKCDSFIKI